MVPKQPLHFGADARCPGRLNYNLRKLSELPHHLLHSGMISELKSSVRTTQQVHHHHHHHHHFICPIIQQYAHLREYVSRRAGQQGPI